MVWEGQEQKIEGVVEKIIFRSAENLYTVFVMRTAEEDQIISGYFYALRPGDEVAVFGKKTRHPRHGDRFSVMRYEKVFSAYQQASGYDGKDGCEDEHRMQIEEELIKLQGRGLSIKEALSVYEHYGPEGLAAIQKNPYQPIMEEVGMSFATADRIGFEVGILEESSYRLQGAVYEVLNEALGKGHTLLTIDEAVKKSLGKLLPFHQRVSVTRQDVQEAINALAEQGVVVDDKGSIALEKAYRAEEEIASSLQRIEDQWRPCQGLDGEAALADFHINGSKLTSSQQQVLKKVITQPVTIITGGPGTGKTALVKALLKVFGGDDKNCPQVLLAAPTGRAARRLTELCGYEAETIHRLLGAKGIEPYPCFHHDRDHPLKGDLLIVDEFSMVDIFLAQKLLETVPPKMGVVLLGDVCQLSSVGPGQVLKDIIDSERFPVSVLTAVFRQEETSGIVFNAHRINQGDFPLVHQTSGDFSFEPKETAEKTLEAVVDSVRQCIQDGYDINEVQVLFPFYKGEVGINLLNQRLRAALNPTFEENKKQPGAAEIFCLGDKVMQTINHYDKEVFNGNIGTVKSVSDEEKKSIEVQFDHRVVTYTEEEQKDLVLAYAVTIHKAQGSEFSVVVIPVYWSERRKAAKSLLYTAVTRAREKVLLIGRKKDLMRSIRKQPGQVRSTGLKRRLGKETSKCREKVLYEE